MRKATGLFFTLLLLCFGGATAQDVEYSLEVPVSDDFEAPFSVGLHSGVRTVSGPHDLDGDGLTEVLVSDYTGGGRVHVIENTGVDAWEWVYSTPVLDSTATTGNIRVIAGGDLDGDGAGEIYFLSGEGFRDTSIPRGLYVFEYTGTDNDYGTAPAAIYTFEENPDRWRAEQMIIQDIDGDGFDELLFGNNGGDNRFDNWYIISVVGDIGTGFEAFTEVRLSSRGAEEFDPVDRGGGSPYGFVAGDFDGDGNTDLSLHSWNNFNFTTGQVTGADAFVFPENGAANAFFRGADADHVSFFGGVVVDIDGDGNDEVFYPRLQIGDVSILNYDPGENTLEITADNFVTGVIPELSTLGIAAGDINNNGLMDLIGSGPSFTNGQFSAGNDPAWIRVAEFGGGDPEDHANYTMAPVFFPGTADASDFDLVVRDSAGVMTEYFEDGAQGPEFVSKIAFLGDADGDGENEVALAFQGVDDSSYVYNEVFNPEDSTYTRTQVSATANPQRVFMIIVSGSSISVATEDAPQLPTGYLLHANYPNPFNPSTAIRFTLPTDESISVKVYDATGRLVRTLVNNTRYPSGTFQVQWDGRSNSGAAVASGAYVYTLEWGRFKTSRTMVLLK